MDGWMDVERRANRNKDKCLYIKMERWTKKGHTNGYADKWTIYKMDK